MSRIKNYIKESKAELKKVTWPTKKDVKNHTLLVIGFSLSMAAFLGAIDFGFSKFIEFFVK
jgi:preprotein translocase subunit SecE